MCEQCCRTFGLLRLFVVLVRLIFDVARFLLGLLLPRGFLCDAIAFMSHLSELGAPRERTFGLLLLVLSCGFFAVLGLLLPVRGSTISHAKADRTSRVSHLGARLRFFFLFPSSSSDSDLALRCSGMSSSATVNKRPIRRQRRHPRSESIAFELTAHVLHGVCDPDLIFLA